MRKTLIPLKGLRNKGYFFMLDGIIAVVVLVTGFIIIGSIFISSPIFKPPYNIGEDLLRVLSTTNMSDINLEIHPELRPLYNDPDIIDDNSSTVLQQVAKFYYKNCTAPQPNKDYIKYANMTVHALIDKVIANPFEADLNITAGIVGCNVDRIYTSMDPDSSASVLSSKTSAKVLMSTQKVVFGNIGSLTLYGPYIFTMIVWG